MNKSTIVDFDTVKQKLFYGLPDDRITKVASKVTVISDKGTKVVLKERVNKVNKKDCEEVPVFLYKSLKYEELDKVISEISNKEVVITSAVYNNVEIRKMLRKI